MRICAKCKTDCQKEGQFIVEDGIAFYFCSYCSQVLEEIGTGNIKNFLYDKKLEMVENDVLKNIISSRIKRQDSSLI